MFFIQMVVLMMTAIAAMVKLKNRYLLSSEVEHDHNYQYQAKLSMQKELKELSRARLHNYYILYISFLFTKQNCARLHNHYILYISFIVY